MTSRRLQTWVWWLLPLLVARALMPVGFMAKMYDGQLQVVFCSAGITQPVMDHGDVSHAQHDASQGDLPCPFAQAAAAPLPQLNSSDSVSFIPTAEVIPPAESRHVATGPPRFIATRGPPAAA